MSAASTTAVGCEALALAALDSLRIVSATSYSWMGTVHRPVSAAVEGAMSPGAARDLLLRQLEGLFYANFYCRGEPTFPPPRTAGPRLGGASAFLERLAAANHGRQTLQPGWRVLGEDSGQVIVEQDGLTLWVDPVQVVPEPDATDRAALVMPAELRKASPGFYMALGEQSLGGRADALVRLYWHLTSAAAPRLLDLLTSTLNKAGLAFQLKVVEDADLYDRCDAGVLYAPRESFPALLPWVRDAYLALRDALRPATPAFTKRLAPGLGLAEDPGNGQSFGMHRCSVLAEAAVLAHERAGHDPLAALRETFAKHDVDPERPYLSPGSSDRYTEAL